MDRELAVVSLDGPDSLKLLGSRILTAFGLALRDRKRDSVDSLAAALLYADC